MILKHCYKVLADFQLETTGSESGLKDFVKSLDTSENHEPLINNLKYAISFDWISDDIIEFWNLGPIKLVIEDLYETYNSPEFEKRVYDGARDEFIQIGLSQFRISIDKTTLRRITKLFEDYVLIYTFTMRLARNTNSKPTDIAEQYISLNKLITLYEYGVLNLYEELLKIDEMPYKFSSLIGYDGNEKIHLKSPRGPILSPYSAEYIKLQLFIDLPYMTKACENRSERIAFWLRLIDALNKDIKVLANYDQLTLQKLYLAFPDSLKKADFNRMIFYLFRNLHPKELLNKESWMKKYNYAAFDHTSYIDFQRKAVLRLMGLRGNYPPRI